MNTPEIFEVPSEPFTFNGKTVQLRGLSLPHVIFIVREHMGALSDLYQKAIEGKIEANAESVALELAEDFAPIVGRVIACGLNRPEVAQEMGNLPLAAQIEALEIIVRLTMSQDGGLEKIMEIVTKAMVRMNGAPLHEV